MKEKISLHIPTPCHEEWNNMTPTQQGRFCGSCAKQVVDFSLMTDQQVLNYFKNNTGNTCGRFMGSQLQRPLQPTAIESKKSWWIALMMPVLLLFDKADAQKNRKQPLLNIAVLKNNSLIKTDSNPPIQNDKELTTGQIETMLLGMVGSLDIIRRDSITKEDTVNTDFPLLVINGTVLDEAGNPLPGATVIVKGTRTGTVANADGSFKLNVSAAILDTLVLQTSYVGFQTREVPVPIPGETDNAKDSIVVNLPPVQCSSQVLGDVVIAGYTISRKETKSIFPGLLPFKEWFRNTAFRVYPNPAIRGTNVNIDLKKEGDYTIQLNDNKGVPHLVKKITVVKGATVVPVTIPAQLPNGMYHILVTDEKKKKRYSDKIIIE